MENTNVKSILGIYILFIIIIIIITHKSLEPGHNSPQLLTAHLWGPHVNVQCSALWCSWFYGDARGGGGGGLYDQKENLKKIFILPKEITLIKGDLQLRWGKFKDVLVIYYYETN